MKLQLSNEEKTELELRVLRVEKAQAITNNLMIEKDNFLVEYSKNHSQEVEDLISANFVTGEVLYKDEKKEKKK